MKMTKRKKTQLIKAAHDKKGVTSRKLPEKMDVDRSFDSRTLREAGGEGVQENQEP